MDSFEKLKRDARQALTEAVRDGYLIPPTHCPRCGEHTVVVGHHFDYTRPLDVHWLCHWCHFCEHQKQLGLPVPQQRRAPVPAYRAPRTRRPKRPPGRPRAAEHYVRDRPELRVRTYGQYLGHPVVRRNGRPAVRDAQHPLARSGFVYVEDLLILAQFARPRQFGDVVTYRDGNRWNWAPQNVAIETRRLDPHIDVVISAPDNVCFAPIDLPPDLDTRVQDILHYGLAGFRPSYRTWGLADAPAIFAAIKALGVAMRVRDVRRSIVGVTVSDCLPPECGEI